MRDALVAAGIPAGAIEVDERGGTTGATVATFRGSVVAVSSPYHALRILYEARRLGRTCAFSPAPSPVMRPPVGARAAGPLRGRRRSGGTS